jgi:hypothetical protein
VSFLILRSGWQLTRDSAHVLLEGTPANFDARQVENELRQLPGVCDIHHLHAWSLTGEAPIVTLHAQIFEYADRQQTLAVILRISARASASNTPRCRSKRSVRGTERRLPRERDDRARGKPLTDSETRQRPHGIPQVFRDDPSIEDASTIEQSSRSALT